jgi:hypothetical protein
LAGAGLYVWGGGGVRDARARRDEGARVVVWPGADQRPLEREGLTARGVTDAIGRDGEEAVLAAERGFARVWARLPLVEGASFRDLVAWRGESLLWACESYLRRATAGPRCAGAVERCLRLLEATDPREVDAGGLAPHDALVLARAAVARGVLFHGETPRPRPLRPGRDAAHASGAPRSILARLGAAGAAVAPEAPLLVIHDGGPAAPVVDALARSRGDASLAATVVRLEDLPRHETGRARAAAAEAECRLRAVLDRLRGTPGLAASYAHRGVAFAELTALDLEAVLLGHLPGAVRVAERARDLLSAARPSLLVVAVEERDRRRAIALAARTAGVPWIALGSLDAADERVDGGPQPAARVAADGTLDEPLARLLAAARDSLRPR